MQRNRNSISSAKAVIKITTPAQGAVIDIRVLVHSCYVIKALLFGVIRNMKVPAQIQLTRGAVYQTPPPVSTGSKINSLNLEGMRG